MLALLDLLFTVYLMITVFFYLSKHLPVAFIVLDGIYSAIAFALFFVGNDSVSLLL